MSDRQLAGAVAAFFRPFKEWAQDILDPQRRSAFRVGSEPNTCTAS